MPMATTSAPPMPTAATTRSKKRTAIHLKYDNGVVVVKAHDEDQFVMSAKKVIDACVASRQHAEFKRQAIKITKDKILNPLRGWCEDHASRISSCYIVPAGKYLQVYVVGATEKYDFDLGRELSKLEISMRDLGWRISCQQIPLGESEEQDSLPFNHGEAMEVYAIGKQAQDEG